MRSYARREFFGSFIGPSVARLFCPTLPRIFAELNNEIRTGSSLTEVFHHFGLGLYDRPSLRSTECASFVVKDWFRTRCMHSVNPLTPTVAVWVVGTAIKHPVPDLCNVWHPGTLTLNHERQSARMSKITSDGLTRSGTGCVLPYCTHTATAGVKELTFSHEVFHDENTPINFVSVSRIAVRWSVWLTVAVGRTVIRRSSKPISDDSTSFAAPLRNPPILPPNDM